jgi:hypothetical protein
LGASGMPRRRGCTSRAGANPAYRTNFKAIHYCMPSGFRSVKRLPSQARAAAPVRSASVIFRWLYRKSNSFKYCYQLSARPLLKAQGAGHQQAEPTSRTNKQNHKQKPVVSLPVLGSQFVGEWRGRLPRHFVPVKCRFSWLALMMAHPGLRRLASRLESPGRNMRPIPCLLNRRRCCRW